MGTRDQRGENSTFEIGLVILRGLSFAIYIQIWINPEQYQVKYKLDFWLWIFRKARRSPF